MSASDDGELPPPDSNIDHAAARSYWSSIDADVNGMLGGFPHVSRVDLQGSRAFLVKLGISAKSAAAAPKRVTRNSEKENEREADGEQRDKKEEGKVEAEKPIARAVDCGAGYVHFIVITVTLSCASVLAYFCITLVQFTRRLLLQDSPRRHRAAANMPYTLCPS